MRAFVLIIMAGACALMSAGCGGPDAAPAAPASTTATSPPQALQPVPAAEPPAAPDTAQTATPAPAATPEPSAAAASPPPDPQALAQALVGTSWVVGDMHVRFVDDSHVFAKGGTIAELSLEGVTAEYTLENGVITASVAGRTITGTWDGKSLVIGGQAAAPQAS